MIDKLIEKYKEQKFSSDFAKSSIEALMVNQKIDEILKDLEELKPTTINGYSIEEVITILNGLNLERILDIKMTMENLQILSEKLQEDFKNALDKSMKNMMNDLGDDNNE